MRLSIPSTLANKGKLAIMLHISKVLFHDLEILPFVVKGFESIPKLHQRVKMADFGPIRGLTDTITPVRSQVRVLYRPVTKSKNDLCFYDIRNTKLTGTSLENPARNHIPLTKIQKLIGERMLKSKLSKPCFYIEAKADVTKLMGLRPKLRKSLGVKITTNAFYIRTLALAAKKYPIMVARLDNEVANNNIRIAEAVNVGFAVNAPHGLVVPVVKTADKKTLAEIAHIEKLLTEKARYNKLTLDEMEGETIALSNLGVYGVDSFLGIVPPPASTILAVGNVINEVTSEDGKAVKRRRVSLSLAVDHRIINGVYAVEFLNFIIEKLQNPQQLV